MDKVVAYLLEKETITGGEMVAILEGRDPATVEDAYASTEPKGLQDGFRPSQPEVIEPAARKVHMISEKIEAPEPQEEKPEEAETSETSAPEEAPNEPDPPAEP